MYSVVQKTKIISHQFMQQTLLYTLGLLNGERNKHRTTFSIQYLLAHVALWHRYSARGFIIPALDSRARNLKAVRSEWIFITA